jgi:hypothetical protein
MDQEEKSMTFAFGLRYAGLLGKLRPIGNPIFVRVGFLLTSHQPSSTDDPNPFAALT